MGAPSLGAWGCGRCAACGGGGRACTLHLYLIQGGGDEAAQLGALHPEVPIELRLALPALANIMASDSNAGKLAHHRQPHREHNP